MTHEILSMLPDELRLAYLDQEISVLSRRIRADRRRASTATLQSAMLGMIELLRDSKFSLIRKLTLK